MSDSDPSFPAENSTGETADSAENSAVDAIDGGPTRGADQSGDGAGEYAARVVSSAAQDIGSFIRSQREAAQVSLRQLAERAGVSNPYLSQIERGLRKPSAEVLGQIAKGLRVSAEALYVRAGILEQREPSPVRDAVLADTAITERQKQVILEIYGSFCRENAAAPTGPESGDPAPE
ncbi:helix-turn-helix transcriptional regulator [Rhodococcus sp. D2-41]|uniref:helix-turn-helix domain-containing protein n=1 Tax=Speluncibacter jeojiensis TaxID=2710754 RepID=UPI00240F6890|nr:helix-turn-helix transcriptional regulator [Rhodococcus sp. D2-41]MDG3009967.1 helix-turn-helix transcriptional regulator [Rhodococcus sp. D2-41]